ncbi:hypothetical protein GCM10027594_05080 [Hymenobacter agri]
MTLSEFDALPHGWQLVAIFDTGRPLMVRWEEEFAFKLYELPGRFFVEVEFDTASTSIIQLRGLTGVNHMEDYEAYIQLPGWLT